MKITITYKTSQQIGPDDWQTHTEVIHFNGNKTLTEVHKTLTGNYCPSWNKKFDGEIHFEMEEDDEGHN